MPMLVGFGCTVPGVMATRTLPSARDRKMTIMLTPFMSCTAKLPIYGFFTSVFFPKQSGIIMIGLYFLGIAMGILTAVISRKTMFHGEAVPFVMELPNYRLPGAKNVLQLMWDKAKDFLQRAFTVIFMASLVIWFLQTFGLHLSMVADSKDSILAAVAGAIAPIFAPLGFGDWRICTLLEVLSPLSAASLLVFCLLYTPCIAAISSIKRELGTKWAVGIVLFQCAVAWVVAFVVHLIGMAILAL